MDPCFRRQVEAILHQHKQLGQEKKHGTKGLRRQERTSLSEATQQVQHKDSGEEHRRSQKDFQGSAKEHLPTWKSVPQTVCQIGGDLARNTRNRKSNKMTKCHRE